MVFVKINVKRPKKKPSTASATVLGNEMNLLLHDDLSMQKHRRQPRVKAPSIIAVSCQGSLEHTLCYSLSSFLSLHHQWQAGSPFGGSQTNDDATVLQENITMINMNLLSRYGSLLSPIANVTVAFCDCSSWNRIERCQLKLLSFELIFTEGLLCSQTITVQIFAKNCADLQVIWEMAKNFGVIASISILFGEHWRNLLGWTINTPQPKSLYL